MLKRIFLSTAALSFLAASLAFGQAKVSETDANAMKKLAEANLGEIEAGKLAADKAQSAQVKQFGQRMVDDHSKMLDQVKQLARSKGVDLPGTPAMEERGRMLALRMKSGQDFDKEYMADMVKDHEKDVQETADLARQVSDPQLKSAIEQAHGKIQEHLAMAKQIAGSQGSASGGTAK
jgi:putative membrane protein